MSLTSFLSNPVIKQKFKETFVNPGFKIKTDIKAPPLTGNYGIVGTAFDYIIRFMVQHFNKEKRVHHRNWVAEASFIRLSKVLAGTELAQLQNRFKKAKASYQKFIATGKISKELLKDALFLAKLDLYFRSRLLVPDLFRENPLDVLDLENLYKNIKTADFKCRNHCFINPVFGEGSVLVGGADADLILDGMLIDIKVTKDLKLKRDYLNQLIGYYILALIGGINEGHKGTLIRKVGIYFARHGVIWSVSLSELATLEKFTVFQNWLVNHIKSANKESWLERLKNSKEYLELLNGSSNNKKPKKKLGTKTATKYMKRNA